MTHAKDWKPGMVPKCGAIKKSKVNPEGYGKPCQQTAGYGTDHVGVGQCKFHGGSTPNGKKSASKVLARREAERMEIPTPARVSPGDALLNALWGAYMDLSLYTYMVDEKLALEPTLDEEAIYSETFLPSGLPSGETKRHALVQMKEDAQKRVAAISVAALKAKVDDARVEVAQANAQSYSEGMRAFALAMGLSPADPHVRQAMRASLQLVAGSAS